GVCHHRRHGLPDLVCRIHIDLATRADLHLTAEQLRREDRQTHASPSAHPVTWTPPVLGPQLSVCPFGSLRHPERGPIRHVTPDLSADPTTAIVTACPADPEPSVRGSGPVTRGRPRAGPARPASGSPVRPGQRAGQGAGQGAGQRGGWAGNPAVPLCHVLSH